MKEESLSSNPAYYLTSATSANEKCEARMFVRLSFPDLSNIAKDAADSTPTSESCKGRRFQTQSHDLTSTWYLKGQVELYYMLSYHL